MGVEQSLGGGSRQQVPSPGSRGRCVQGLGRRHWALGRRPSCTSRAWAGVWSLGAEEALGRASAGTWDRSLAVDTSWEPGEAASGATKKTAEN